MPAVLASANVTTTVGTPAPALQEGVTSQLPITVTNSGSGPTTGSTTVTIPLPAGVTPPGPFISGAWNCTTSGSTVTCTNNLFLPAGAVSPISIPVTPGHGAGGTVLPTIGPITTVAPGDPHPCAGNGAGPFPAVLAASQVKLTLKVFLGGATNINSITDVLIRDDLRRLNRLPTIEPYTGLSGFTHSGGGGGEQVNASVFTVPANPADAIVDWVFIELRNAVTPVPSSPPVRRWCNGMAMWLTWTVSPPSRSPQASVTRAT